MDSTTSLDSTTSPDSLVNAANDTAYVQISTDSIQTKSCDAPIFTCAAAIHGAGTMTLTVNAFGRRVANGAAAWVQYVCPLEAPLSRLLGLDEVGIAGGEPVVLGRAVESVPASPADTPVPLPMFTGTGPVSFWGPFVKIADVSPYSAGNFPTADYKVGRGQDWNGLPAVVTPWLGLPHGSWLRFSCRVSLKKDATLSGQLQATGVFHAVFNPHPTP
jgi:hypothetical protein